MGKVRCCLFSSSCPSSHHLDIRDCFHRGKVIILEAELLSWSSTQIKITCDTFPYTFLWPRWPDCPATTLQFIPFQCMQKPCNADTEVLRCCFSCCRSETEVTFTINGKKYTGMWALWMYWLRYVGLVNVLTGSWVMWSSAAEHDSYLSCNLITSRWNFVLA